MLPSSLAGIAIFIAVLTPGLVYELRKERTIPAARLSAIRETMWVVTASAGCLLMTGLMLSLVRVLWPSGTIDIGALLRAPDLYVVEHHARLAWWSLVALALACLCALAAADPRVAGQARSLASRSWVRTVIGTTETDIRPTSAWSRVFTLYDDEPAGTGYVLVGAQLEDGTYVRGTLSSHSADIEDSPDREMVLRAPLGLRTTDGAWHELGTTHAVVSARRIMRLDVTHIGPL